MRYTDHSEQCDYDANQKVLPTWIQQPSELDALAEFW